MFICFDVTKSHNPLKLSKLEAPCFDFDIVENLQQDDGHVFYSTILKLMEQKLLNLK